jgi:hypothetical protein
VAVLGANDVGNSSLTIRLVYNRFLLKITIQVTGGHGCIVLFTDYSFFHSEDAYKKNISVDG